jgi:hypothetical protein
MFRHPVPVGPGPWGCMRGQPQAKSAIILQMLHESFPKHRDRYNPTSEPAAGQWPVLTLLDGDGATLIGHNLPFHDQSISLLMEHTAYEKGMWCLSSCATWIIEIHQAGPPASVLSSVYSP